MKSVVLDGLAVLSLVIVSSATAFAQSPPVDAARRLSAAEVRSIPVAWAKERPLVGERVADESGAVDEAYFAESQVCTVRGCRVFVYDRRSGALVHMDGVWSAAYAKTGRGREVIRVRPFTEDELPKPAPDDTALEQAPAIKRVVRPETAEKEAAEGRK